MNFANQVEMKLKAWYPKGGKWFLYDEFKYRFLVWKLELIPAGLNKWDDIEKSEISIQTESASLSMDLKESFP